MSRNRPLLLLLFLLSTRLASAAPAEAPAAFQWKQTATSLALLDGTRIVWQLNYDPREGKPYFHPITASDGSELTALRPPDHPWHRGLWWSWKYINGLNYWDEDKSGQSQGTTSLLSVEVTANADFSAHIMMKLSYHPPGRAPLLMEDRVIDVSRPAGSGGYTISWQAKFTAGDQPVLLDRTPLLGEPKGFAHGGYAGLSLRLAPRAKEWDFFDSEGGHSEADIHGKTARYVEFGLPGGPSFRLWDDEKANPRFPTSWYASKQLQYVGAAFLYRGPYTLPAGKQLDFAYRVTVQPRLASAAPEVKVVNLATVAGKMKYDLEAFEVMPGGRVTLHFRNGDDMLHNVVVCQAPLSFAAELGEAALRMGEAGLKKNYVPDLPQILAHTPLVEPGQEQTISFVAPAIEGDYPYLCTMPGHWMLMKGVMHVTKSAHSGAAKAPVTPPPVLPVDEILVQETARVDRLPMPDSHPTALAVGLPGGFNYCFDVETLAVRYAWTGRYIDNAPNMSARGGKPVKLLGPRLEVGYAGGPWLGDNTRPALLFKGYRVGPAPALYFTIDGVPFTQTVAPAIKGPGIISTFEVGPTSAPIHFKINPTGLNFSASAGEWQDGVLTVPSAGPSQTTRFSITLGGAK